MELELVYNFLISRSSSNISLAKVQYADLGLQPEISQEWSKICKSCVQFQIPHYLECHGPNLKHIILYLDIGGDTF